jgi:translation elongation factor EF-G
MPINLNDYTYCVLSERILLFCVSSYAKDSILECLNYFYDWGLLDENGMIKANDRYLNNFLNHFIDQTVIEMEKMAQKHRMVLKYFDLDVSLDEYCIYFKDEKKVAEKMQKMINKKMIKNKKLPKLCVKNFENYILFDNLKCLGLTGEQKEILLNSLKNE